jgi:hypothetical protein
MWVCRSDGDTTIKVQIVQVRVTVIWPVAAFELMAEEVCEIEGLVGVWYYAGLGPGLRKIVERLL